MQKDIYFKNISSPEDANKALQTELTKLITLLSENHKAKWFAGADKTIELVLKKCMNILKI